MPAPARVWYLPRVNGDAGEGADETRPAEENAAAGGKRHRNRLKRRASIVSAGHALFLERGLDAVTVEEITRAAGTSKGNFYRYFDSKAALVEAIIAPLSGAIDAALDRCAEALAAAVDLDATRGAYRALAFDIAALALGHRDAAHLYLRERRGAPRGERTRIVQLGEEVERRAVALTRVAVDRGLIRVADSQVSALVVVGAMQTLALVGRRGALEASPADAGRTVVDIILDGIRA